MTVEDKIEILLTSIRLSWMEIVKGIDPEAAKRHILWCYGELRQLVLNM